MTDANYTHITVLLDESGSMGHLAEDTRGGFNNFLTEQQAVEGKATMTVCKFSSGYTILSSMRDIKSVEPLTVRTYSPGGGTALLDAMGRCITELGSALAKMPEEMSHWVPAPARQAARACARTGGASRGQRTVLSPES